PIRDPAGIWIAAAAGELAVQVIPETAGCRISLARGNLAAECLSAAKPCTSSARLCLLPGQHWRATELPDQNAASATALGWLMPRSKFSPLRRDGLSVACHSSNLLVRWEKCPDRSTYRWARPRTPCS